MTQPSSARPVPGPPRPAGPAGVDAGRPTVPSGVPAPEAPDPHGADHGLEHAADHGPEHRPDHRLDHGTDPFAGLDERPVDQQVAVFEAEHDRLQRRLGGIDQV